MLKPNYFLFSLIHEVDQSQLRSPPEHKLRGVEMNSEHANKQFADTYGFDVNKHKVKLDDVKS